MGHASGQVCWTTSMQLLSRIADVLWGLAAICFCVPWIAGMLNVSLPNWIVPVGRVIAVLFMLVGAVCFLLGRPKR